jgi:hypothetical protein
MERALPTLHSMIREIKKWMCYEYYHRQPGFRLRTTFLFSPVKKKIRGMVCIPFPTMLADIRECDFVNSWSKSCRYKINKANSETLSIQRGNDLLPEILELFGQTARRKKLRGYCVEDFHTRPWIYCSAVYAEEKILAGHVWLIDEEEKKGLLFVNATAQQSPDEDSSLTGRAHYYLLHEDGLHLRNHGIDYLDLNGYRSSAEDESLAGVYRWKEATHGQAEELYHYYPAWFYWIRKWKNQT